MPSTSPTTVHHIWIRIGSPFQYVRSWASLDGFGDVLEPFWSSGPKQRNKSSRRERGSLFFGEHYFLHRWLLQKKCCGERDDLTPSRHRWRSRNTELSDNPENLVESKRSSKKCIAYWGLRGWGLVARCGSAYGWGWGSGSFNCFMFELSNFNLLR